VAHSLIHQDDLDQSLPHPHESHRLFFGVEADLLITGSHRAYAMFLLEHDLNREQDPNQDWDYNANYFGLGAKGTILAGWGYSGEAILEFGQTASAGTTEKDSILAFALLLTTDYQFQGPMEPAIRLQYMFGSGDSDRASVSDMAAGNQAGTTDTSFLSFGFVQTGFSLFPRVSNIHIVRLGGLDPAAGIRRAAAQVRGGSLRLLLPEGERVGDDLRLARLPEQRGRGEGDRLLPSLEDLLRPGLQPELRLLLPGEGLPRRFGAEFLQRRDHV
jgi:hypothetical protein